MTRIRIAAARNAAALIIICCCMLTQTHATNSDTRNIPSIFRSNGLSQNKIKMQAKKRIKMNHKVKPSDTVPVGDSFQLRQEVSDEKSSRQRDQQQTQVPSSNNTDVKQIAPTVGSASFTVSPVSIPGKKSNAPVRAPTILPVLFDNPLPTSKPIISVPLSVATSQSPTTFLTDSSNTPSATRSSSPTTLGGGNTITAPPSPVLVITPVTAPIVSDKDAVLGNEPGTTSSSGKAESGTIVGVVLAVIVSMIVSIMVLRVRHKYVQKHGAASTRRRRGKVEQQQQESGILTDDIDQNAKTVRIITSNDHDTASPDRTFEIHLDDDEVDNAHIYSQESSFISTSGGEEIESDLDQNITTPTKRKNENS